MKTKILVVDDHPMLRSGLRQAMSQQTDFTLAGEASTGAEGLKLAKELELDLVVLDIHLPDMNGIEVARQILAIRPSVKIVIFSSDIVRTVVDEALQAGACGYVSKSSALEELVLAVDSVMAGRLYLSKDVSAGVLEEYRKNLAGNPEPVGMELSEREKKLLRLVAEGRRNKEIATQLGVTPKAIEANRSRLMKKLGVSSSAELVRYAVRQGIAEP